MGKIKESNFQDRIINSLKEKGHRVKKLQSGMGYTLLDLYVRHRKFGAQFWELKTVKTFGSSVNLTPLQRKEMRDEIRAGGSAACVVCVKNGPVESIYVIGPEETHVREQYHIQDRRRGESIDIDRIANAVFAETERFRVWEARGKP